MFGDNDFRSILHHMAMQQSFENVARDFIKEHAIQKLAGRTKLRRLIECDSNIETAITDKDMLLLRIDVALDSGDEKQFKLLTDELRELEGLKGVSSTRANVCNV